MRKIAIPTKEDQVDDHFGHCAYYTVYTLSETMEVEETELIASPQGCGCKSDIASILRRNGVDLMLAGNMGEGAYQTLRHHGLDVIRGCKGKTEDVLQSFIDGNITDSGEGCASHEQHHAHGHHQGHGHSCGNH